MVLKVAGPERVVEVPMGVVLGGVGEEIDPQVQSP